MKQSAAEITDAYATPGAASKETWLAALLPALALREFPAQSAASLTFASAGQMFRLFDGLDPEQAAINLFNGRISSAYAAKEEEEDEDENDEDEGEGEDEDEAIDVESLIESETNRAAIEIKQSLDSARQQAFGITHYVWVGGECTDCAALEGEIFEWGEGEEPGGVHPNCNCSGEPVVEGAGDPVPPDDPPIEPVYLIESLIGLLAGGGLARQIGIAAIRGLGILGRRALEELGILEETAPAKPEQTPAPSTGKEPPPGGRNLKWELGKNKSDFKWNNRMEQRGWTKEKIDDTIKNGKEYPAPNKPNPENGATRFEKNGKYVVRDNKTGEILQISGENFIPEELP